MMKSMFVGVLKGIFALYVIGFMKKTGLTEEKV